MKASGASASNSVSMSQATVAGNTYKVTVDVDVASGPAMSLVANGSSQNLAQVSVTTNGTYSYTFVALGSSTQILFTNGGTGPRDFYLDNVD